MKLTEEQAVALNNSISELGMLSNGIKQKLDSFNDAVSKVKEDTVAIKQIKGTVVETKNILGDIANELDKLYDAQKVLFEALTGREIKSPDRRKKTPTTAPVTQTEVAASPMKDFMDSILGFLKGPFITPFIVSGITYLLGEYILSDEVKNNIKAFFAGLLGTDYKTLEDGWKKFTIAVEGATAALAAYFAFKLGSGIFRLFGRKLPFGGRGALLAALAAAGYAVGDEVLDLLFPDDEGGELKGDASIAPEDFPASTELPADAAAVDGDAMQAIFDAIARGEGSYNTPGAMGPGYTEYDTIYGYGQYGMPNKPVSQMTFSELYDYQRQLIGATRGKIPGTTSGTSAVGKYQMVATSLYGRGRGPNNPDPNSWFGRSGLKPGDKFSPENQELLVREIAKDMGMASKLASGDFAGLQNSIAQQFASQKTSTGADIYSQGAKVGLGAMTPLYTAARNQMTNPQTSLASAGSLTPKLDSKGSVDLSYDQSSLNRGSDFQTASRAGFNPQSVDEMLSDLDSSIEVTSTDVVINKNSLNQQITQLNGGSTISPVSYA